MGWSIGIASDMTAHELDACHESLSALCGGLLTRLVKILYSTKIFTFLLCSIYILVTWQADHALIRWPRMRRMSTPNVRFHTRTKSFPHACMRGVPTRGEKLEIERGVLAGCERGVTATRGELPPVDRGVADSAVRGVPAEAALAAAPAVVPAVAPAVVRGVRSTLAGEPWRVSARLPSRTAASDADCRCLRSAAAALAPAAW